LRGEGIFEVASTDPERKFATDVFVFLAKEYSLWKSPLKNPKIPEITPKLKRFSTLHLTGEDYEEIICQ
jgi:hypothetical protein